MQIDKSNYRQVSPHASSAMVCAAIDAAGNAMYERNQRRIDLMRELAQIQSEDEQDAKLLAKFAVALL